MTNEERHIAVLNRLLDSMNVFDSIQPTEERKKAIKAAIQALSLNRVKNELNVELNELKSCDDAISREDRLIDLANAIESDDSGYWTNKRISSVLRNIPSVTQKCEKCAMNGSGSKYCDNCKQKSGKWSHDGSHWKNRFICSECGYKLFDEPTNFCPSCGAKMQESEDKE